MTNTPSFSIGVPCTSSSAFGLRTTDKSLAIPLTNVEVKISVLDFLASVTVEQSYHNYDDHDSAEVIYTFPLPSNATLRHFEARLHDTVIMGQVGTFQ